MHDVGKWSSFNPDGGLGNLMTGLGDSRHPRLTVESRVSKLHAALSMCEQTVDGDGSHRGVRADFTNYFLIYYTTMQPDPPSGSPQRWLPKISSLDEESCIVTTIANMICFTEIISFYKALHMSHFWLLQKLFLHPILWSFSNLYFFFICCTLNMFGRGWKQGGLGGGASSWLLRLSLTLGEESAVSVSSFSQSRGKWVIMKSTFSVNHHIIAYLSILVET